MTSNNNPQSHLSWCFQQKRGIKIEKPNDNLCKAYILKAKSALNMLASSLEKQEIEWIATTAYYARYFAFYALLQKCGISSEIHDCTLSLMQHLFVEQNLIQVSLFTEFYDAKDLRTEVQYYVTEELDKQKIKVDAKTAWAFVLKLEEVIEKMTEEDIEIVRTKLRKAQKN